jgi:tetratricopeptide (TPR) repeat protein
MKKAFLTMLLFVFVMSIPGFSQNKPDNSKIDLMLIHGEFARVIDTCKLILLTDTLNAEVYYKLGLAYQNILSDDKASDCFQMAATISPENNIYSFTVAKNYYTKGKSKMAKPILSKLYAADTMNWPYAWYLTSVYMQEAKYDESIKIYARFYKQDSTNYVFTDKIGFACLRKGDSEKAIEMFNRSLALNPKDINAIKNVSFLYATSHQIDTALQLLSRGIELDPADMDLYARRAALNFSINYTKRALNDYLKILSSGDTTFLYLKRAGIGYANNLQPKEAVQYLLKAHQKDTTDLEVMTFLARNYENINDPKNSSHYYNKIIKLLNPVVTQLGMTYILLAEMLKKDNQNPEAISAYLKSQNYRSDISIYINIANLYDEKLKDIPNAIRYYELFLNKQKNLKGMFGPQYIESIRKRVESLKKMKQTPK